MSDFDLAMHLLRNPPLPLDHWYRAQSVADAEMRKLKRQLGVLPQQPRLSPSMDEIVRVLKKHFPDGQFADRGQILEHSNLLRQGSLSRIYDCVKSHVSGWPHNPRVLWAKQNRGGKRITVFALNLNYVDPSRQ